MAGPATYFDPTRTASLPEPQRDLVERRARSLGSAYRLFYEHPLQLVRGHGTTVWDADGREYLDAYNNVPAVGHAHPRVVAAIAEQAATLNTHTRYLDARIVEYAEDLLATLPEHIGNAMFTCTGSEANDLALRIAKHATGADGVIVTRNAYHGVTTEIAAISPSLGGLDSLAPWARIVEPLDLTGGVRTLLEAGFRPAAIIVDTILASDGIVVNPDLADAVELVRAAGGLYIADEVQPGFGRLGTGMWGFDRLGLSPDIVTVGKPMANGHPVAAMLARRELVDAFGRDVRYFNTFGGNAVSMAAAQATLDVIRDEQLIENARAVGSSLLTDLATLDVVDVRGVGLYIGVELDSTDRTVAVVNRLRERGVLLAASGVDNTVLKIRPPLVFSAHDATRLVTELAAALR